NRNYLAMCSVEGGVEIEQVAEESPDRLARINIDPTVGVDVAKAREIAAAGHLPEEVLDAAAVTIAKLYDVFVKSDASLVEVNPLVRTPDDEILALDGKVTLDENAEFRHPEVFADFADAGTTDPLEQKAKENDLNYVKLDGEVGIIGNGAGLVMSTLDVVAYAGEAHKGVKPANFLDIGGGASAEVMANGLDVILGDEQVKSVFVNVFGGITACDAVANGIVKALEILGDEANKPLVVRLDGNNVDEGRKILADANHPLVTLADNMDSGADKAAELAAKSEEKEPEGMPTCPNSDSKVIVQGIAGGGGTKPTARMLAAGPQIVGGVNARKAGTTVTHKDADGNDVELPVFGGVAEAMEATGADVTILFVPPPFTKDAIIEAVDAEIPLAVVITEGAPVLDTATAWNYNLAKGGKTRIIGPNCPGVITPGESLVGITPANITGKGPI